MLTDSGIISPFVPDSGNIFRKISSKDPIITLTLNVSVKCLIGNIEQDFLTSSSEWLGANVGLNLATLVVFWLTSNGYCASDLPSFELELCDDDVDDKLFNKAVRMPSHVLHSLLPPPSNASQKYNLRKRTRVLQLPEHTTHLSDKNFITRMLYKNS